MSIISSLDDHSRPVGSSQHGSTGRHTAHPGPATVPIANSTRFGRMAAPLRRCRAWPSPRSRRRAALALALALLTAASPAKASLSPTPESTFATNGTVHAITVLGDTAYLGGDFTQVGPRTGSGVGIDASTARSVGLPQVSFGPTASFGPGSVGAQSVSAVVADGSGGWYIGGEFNHVGGMRRVDLAHIRANGTVDPRFRPNPNGTVFTLAIAGSKLYVGGAFTTIGGRHRSLLAALERSTGRATRWNPGARGQTVRSLAVAGATIYAGGNFKSIGGRRRHDIAALSARSGRARGFDPNPHNPPLGMDSTVRALAVQGPTVYAGGDFGSIGGQTRAGLAALDATTGKATAWNPGAVGYPTEEPFVFAPASISALALRGSTIYVGGVFTTIGGQGRTNLAALDTATGKATAWDPEPAAGGANVYVDAIAVSGSIVYVAGDFASEGGQARNNLAAIDAATAAATPWNPGANAPVYALALHGSTVYAGGSMTSIDGIARNGLAAIDLASGRPTSWAPDAGLAAINVLAASSGTIYVGGTFDTIAGASRTNLAALDATTGNPTAWNPDVGGQAVDALAISGSTVYAGGTFSKVGGQPRRDIAAIDAATSAPTAWNPNAAGLEVFTLAVSDHTVYVGGTFSSIGGRARHYLAALSATSARASTWNPDPDGTVDALALHGSTIYAGGSFSSIGGRRRCRIAAFNGQSRHPSAWTPFHCSAGVIGNEPDVMTVLGRALYVGGEFVPAGLSRGRRAVEVAGIDRRSGRILRWDPDANDPEGDGVLALATHGSKLLVGGGFSGFRLVPQEGFAVFASRSG